MADVSVVKVEQDGTDSFSEITNHGLVTALNSVYDGGSPEPAKTESISSIVNAAANGGSLRSCSIAKGDIYFGIVVETGYVKKLEFVREDDGLGDGKVVRGIKIGTA